MGAGIGKHVQNSEVYSEHQIVTDPQIKKVRPKNQDVDMIYNQNIEKYFSKAKKTTSTYLQSVTDLQVKIIESWKKSMDSAITLQRRFTNESKMNFEVPDATIKMMDDLTEQANKAQALQNKLVLDSIEAITQNINAFNNNVITFTQVNRKLAKSCGFQMPTSKIRPEKFKAAISEFKKVIGDIKIEQKQKSKRR